jgi:tetraacyldisaccharide 4'-kinase
MSIFGGHYEPLDLISPEGEREELHSMRGKRVLAVSGIANPNYFSSLLKKYGMEILREMIFPDHHLYTTKDLNSIQKKVNKVDLIVTTEKDMVKLMELNISHLPIRALRIEMKIWEEEEFYKRMMEIFSDKKNG